MTKKVVTPHWKSAGATIGMVITALAGSHFQLQSNMADITASEKRHWQEERIRKEIQDAATDAKDSADRAFIMRQNDTIISYLKK